MTISGPAARYAAGEPRLDGSGREEQLEFLRREDIRTMAKDMARLREEESKKEQKRIVQMQEEKKKPATPVPAPAAAPPPAAPEPPKISLMPTEQIRQELPAPPSKAKKVIIRIVIFLLLAFIALNIVVIAYSLFRK